MKAVDLKINCLFSLSILTPCLNCQSCQYGSVPTRRTDAPISLTSSKGLRTGGRKRSVYIGVYILKLKIISQTKICSQHVGKTAFWSSIPPQNRPSIQPGGLSDRHPHSKAVFWTHPRSFVVNFNGSFRYHLQSLYHAVRKNRQLRQAASGHFSISSKSPSPISLQETRTSWTNPGVQCPLGESALNRFDGFDGSWPRSVWRFRLP